MKKLKQLDLIITMNTEDTSFGKIPLTETERRREVMINLSTCQHYSIYSHYA